MCGLVGIAGKLEYKDEATMKRLLLLDYLRGPDSTGLAAIRGSTGEVLITKIASNPIDLFDIQRFKTALSGSTSHAFIGHNRAATRGIVSAANAHPYQFDHIIGAHNGTLDYQSTRRLEEAAGEQYPVDSMAIFDCISKIGIEDTVKLMETGKDDKTGAWALVWYDTKEHTINFLRNQHRPLWYAWTKNYDRLFWASEWKMLDVSIDMSVQGYEMAEDTWSGAENKKQKFKFFPFETDVHYSFPVHDLKKSDGKKIKAKAKTLKGREPVPATPAAGGSDPFLRAGGANSTTLHGTTGVSNITRLRDDVGDKTVVHLITDEDEPYAGLITRDRFEALSKYGCSYCNTDVEFGRPGITIWDRDDIILCSECGPEVEGLHVHVTNMENLL